MSDITPTAEDLAAGCNCNEENIIVPCPVHSKTGDNGFGEKIVVISDENLWSPDPQRWIGHVFTCPSCGEVAVLHDANFCKNCGVKVKVSSSIVTKHIRNMYK